MIRYFLARPVAVLTIFFCVGLGGFLAYLKLPVSLMPDIQTPRLAITVNYQGYGAEYIEQNVLADLRNQLSGLYGLQSIESISANNVGHLDLVFEYQTDMKLAFIEANEKLDQSISYLPKELPRPQVHRIADTDIPVLKLHIQSDQLAEAELSDLTQYVFRRRIEGINGVAKVSLNGLSEQIISLEPKEEVLKSLKVSENEIIQVLRQANFDQFQLKVREGIYEYNVRIENPLNSIASIRKLQITVPTGEQVTLDRLADITYRMREPVGTHVYQGKQAIVINVHKQASSNMGNLEKDILRNIEQLSQEYPNINFNITQNQSSLLSMSIRQLSSSLILGGVLAFIILFIFSANYKLSVLMGLIIPMTILVTFGIFYFADLSINIITLSGLILGVGMLIDNAIILIDNIHLHRQNGLSLFDACIKGANEIFTPLLSAAFTTLSVFLPLIFLGGIGGSFFQFQALSLGAMLLSSLVVAFCLLPVLYYLLKPKPANDSSKVFSWLLTIYRRSKKRANYVNGMLVLVLIVALGLIPFIPINSLPDLKTKSAALSIVWSDPVTIEENVARTLNLISSMDSGLEVSAFDVGINSLDPSQPTFTNSLIGYFQFADESAKQRNIKALTNMLKDIHAKSNWKIERARNPFDQLFSSNSSFIKVKYRPSKERMLQSTEVLEKGDDLATLDYGFITQKGLYLDINEERLSQVNVTTKELLNQIKLYYQDQLVTEIQRTNRKERIQLSSVGNRNLTRLNAAIRTKDSSRFSYPLKTFFDWSEVQVNQFVTADLAGIYQSISYGQPNSYADFTIASIKEKAAEQNLVVDLEGDYFSSDKNSSQLMISLVLSVLLLYFILAAQFESLIQPVIILITLPIALSGAVLALYFFSYSFNISSLIGMIVTLGIIVNDSILKIDTINRMRAAGKSLKQSLTDAGELRLKPILMTSVTTILALFPLILSSGLGADLQAPLAVTVIGGLSIGTLCSVYMIPQLYHLLIKN